MYQYIYRCVVHSTTTIVLHPAATVALSAVAPPSQQPHLLHLCLAQKAIRLLYVLPFHQYSRCSPPRHSSAYAETRGRTFDQTSSLEKRKTISSTHLQLFERILKLLSVYAENEFVVRRYLKRIVSCYLRLSMENIWVVAGELLDVAAIHFPFDLGRYGTFEVSYIQGTTAPHPHGPEWTLSDHLLLRRSGTEKHGD